LCGESIFSFNSRAQNRAQIDIDFSEHLRTHPDRRLEIIEGGSRLKPRGLSSNFL
jgi:hypothetical protein